MDPELEALWQEYRQAWAAWRAVALEHPGSPAGRELSARLWAEVNRAADAIDLAMIERRQ
jgi:hypothetical protein